MRISSKVSLLALALASAASAQDAEPTTQAQEALPADEQDDESEIVVTASRIPGQVQTDSPPVLELNEEEVAAYGATSIADLVAQLAPQTGSGRGRGGRPVFLVNGQRVSNFRELGRFPPEAIRKVEVLPEEVALQFGFPPDARVVNFILKPSFASREVEVEFGMPGRGGYTSGEAEAGILTINGSRRVNANIGVTRRGALTEAERDVIQTIDTDPAITAAGLDPADFRTLVSRQQTVEANATVTQGLGEMGSGGQLTLNGQVSRSVTDSLSGIDPITLDPIDRRTDTDTYALGTAYNLGIGAWQLSTTLDASRTDSDSRIDRRGGGGTDRSLSRTWSANPKTTISGSPFILPAGEANLTLDAGYDWGRIESTDTRGAANRTSLTRGNLNGGASLSLPVTSTREGFLDAIGDLSVNIGGGVDYLSDFGTLTDWNAGLNWRPTERLSFQASTIVREVAPGLSQLGGPIIEDVNVPVYDFTTGQTVLASVISGGNPNLLAETQRDLKLSASYDFDLFDRASIRAEYFRNNSENTTEGFPLLTPAIEAAFPDRVTRAADGTLLAVDRRAVTFAERRSSRIRYGINLFGRVGKPSPQSEGGGGGRGGFRAMMGAAQPAQSQPSSTPQASTQTGAGGPAAGGQAGRQGGGFDPARFAEMRTKFCATPQGEVPDLTGIPEAMLARLKGADGQIDPARVAELRTRFCNADGTPNTQGGTGRFDPAQFAALRTALACGSDGQVDVAALPAQIADRLKGPDGTIDQARLAELRTRICALPAGGPQGRRGEGGPAAGAAPAAGPTAGGGGRRGGGGPGGMMGGGDGQGRWNLSVYHSIELNNRALVAPGGPALDLLSGDALGEGGVSRHRIEFEGGLFKDGLGARISGRYSSPTTVNGSGLPGSSDLRFGALATFDLRVFANLEQQEWLTGSNGLGFWKGTRLGLRVNNVLDAQQRVTDSSGVVPLRYQPGLVDPTGRFFEIELRKLF